MKKIMPFLLVILLCQNLQAQTIYAVSNDKNIYRINEDYTATYISTAGPTQYLINDIAISPSGKMYGISYNTLYEINIVSGAATFIADMPPNYYTSLICSNDNKLYMINSFEKTLYRYDLITNEATIVANIGFETPGDLTFYKGNLIFQTYNDNGTIYMVKAYNLETGNLTDIMCQWFYFQLWGLTNLFTDCSNGTILASNPETELMSLDFDTQTFTNLPLQFPSDLQIFGLATTTEHLGSLCESENLANLDCEQLYIPEFLQNEIAFYPNPAKDKLYFKNFDRIEKLTIYDIAGKPVYTLDKPSASSIDIAELSFGVYLLKIEGNKTVTFKKFIKQ